MTLTKSAYKSFPLVFCCFLSLTSSSLVSFAGLNGMTTVEFCNNALFSFILSDPGVVIKMLELCDTEAICFLAWIHSKKRDVNVATSSRSYILLTIFFQYISSMTPWLLVYICSHMAAISASLFRWYFSLSKIFSKLPSVSRTWVWINLNSSSHSFLSIFANSVTWWSSLR